MLLVTPTVQEDEAGNSIELIEEVNTSADDSEKFNSNNSSSKERKGVQKEGREGGQYSVDIRLVTKSH